MYCAKCDRWEYDQIACEDGICLRCYGPLVDPDEGHDDAEYHSPPAHGGEHETE